MKIILSFICLLLLVLGYKFDTGLDPLHDYNYLDDSWGLQERDLLFGGNSTGLQEFEPIRNTIVQSETQYYSFAVNTTDGLGSYYQFLIFLTGNICSQPSNVQENDTGVAVYYSFNGSMFQNFALGEMQLFENGYFQALAEVPVTENDTNPGNDFSILYIGVRAPENTNSTAQWSYQIGVSQNDLVFQWDDRSWTYLIDTDASSALITTGNLTSAEQLSQLNASESQYSLYIYSYDYVDYFDQLNSSWCAIRNGPALFDSQEIQTSYTNRLGSLQQQFFVQGLNASTKYIAYLISDFKGNTYGGAVYQPFEFETMDDDACQLIYDLDFCNKVSYSVPAASNVSKENLKFLYDQQAQEHYANFLKALSQIACDTTDDAAFSPMKSCDDCASTYKEWLCSVTIPRCSTRNQTGYIFRDVDQSRSDFINKVIRPNLSYYEILPCIGACYSMVRDCPADFGFGCPTTNHTISQSYYWWDSSTEWPSCNYYSENSVLSKGWVSYTVNYWLLVVCILMSILV